MSESACCTPGIEIAVRDVPGQRALDATLNTCPECNQPGKSIHWQTIKSLLSVSLRQVSNAKYLFCRTRTCPVVYFSVDGKQTFTVEQIRERVYQKEPEAPYVDICYCFRYTASELRAASSESRTAVLNEINTGVQAGQCACDLRNPQGTCCLGNVRELIKQLEEPDQQADF
jgi:hypothetical protein